MKPFQILAAMLAASGALTFLVACNPQYDEVCNKACDCPSANCSSKERKDCAKQFQNQEKAAGKSCKKKFEDAYDCKAENYECNDDPMKVPSSCTDQQAALEDCMNR